MYVLIRKAIGDQKTLFIPNPHYEEWLEGFYRIETRNKKIQDIMRKRSI